MRTAALILALSIAAVPAIPALAQETANDPYVWTDTTPYTVVASGGCAFATLDAAGNVSIDRACLEKAAERCKPVGACEPWDAVARLMKSVIDGTYSEVSK